MKKIQKFVSKFLTSLIFVFFLTGIALSFLLGKSLSTSVLAQSQNGVEHKVWVCHATASEQNPYHVVDVDEDAWNEHTSAHSDHKNDFLYEGDSDEPSEDETWCENNVPSSSLACENPNYLESYLDKIDLGDSTSETAHNVAGWGADPGSGNYGGRDGGQTFSLVVANNECNEEGGSASFTLNAGTNYANKIVIRHLDGLSNLDSFDVFANGNLVGHYTDTQDTAEIWITTEFPIPDLTGLINVEIKLTDNIWPSCKTWGQLAINWVEITGYECPEEESPPTPDVCANIDGTQTVIPEGMHLDASGLNCVNWSQAGPPVRNDEGIGGQVLGASTGQVLGASTLGATGSAEENIFLMVFTVGATFLGMGVRKHASRAHRRA